MVLQYGEEQRRAEIKNRNSIVVDSHELGLQNVQEPPEQIADVVHSQFRRRNRFENGLEDVEGLVRLNLVLQHQIVQDSEHEITVQLVPHVRNEDTQGIDLIVDQALSKNVAFLLHEQRAVVAAWCLHLLQLVDEHAQHSRAVQPNGVLQRRLLEIVAVVENVAAVPDQVDGNVFEPVLHGQRKWTIAIGQISAREPMISTCS